VDAETGAERWGRRSTRATCGTTPCAPLDPETGLYKDQSIGDTPKPYTISVNGKPTRVVGAGCKNGAYYVLDLKTGELLHNTPLYTGAPAYPPKPAPTRAPWRCRG